MAPARSRTHLLCQNEPTQEFDADSTLTFLESPARRRFNKAVAIGGLTAYAVYLVYRTLFTINPDALVFSIAVYFAEVHGFLSLFFYFFQTWEIRGRRVPPPPEAVSVDVFITTYNEDVDLLRQTVRGAMAMDYPHTTYILDDGRRAAVKALADELGCQYMTRATNEHAKAGNWNNAFRQTEGELIATFDADHVPRADFLLRTLGFFRDPKVALVQVPQRYHNVDSLQHRVDWKSRRMYGEQDVFFNLVCPGKDHWNSAFFCGTGAVLRRSALEPHGGLQTGSITEDMHTSLALHAEGWKSVYLDELLVTGLAPMDFGGFRAQRLRWAEGNLKIVRAINPIVYPGLTLPQRISYGASMYHWTIGVPKFIFYLAPPWMLFTGSYPIANFNNTFVWIYTLFLVSLVVSCKVLSRGHGSLIMDEVFNMANVFTLNQAVKRLLFGRGRPARFVVTDKRGGGTRNVRDVLPHLLLVLFSLLAVEWGLLSLKFNVADDWFGGGVAIFWVLYNLLLACMVVGFALRPAQKRVACRFPAALPVRLLHLDERRSEVGMTANISSGGCELWWPHPLREGTVQSFAISFGSITFKCSGEVTAAFRKRQGDWVAHGVRFKDLTTSEIDFLNDAMFNLVVPRLFHHLSHPPLGTRLRRWLLKRLRARFVTRSARALVSLPVRLDWAEGSLLTMTHDVSSSGFGVIAARAIAPGTCVTLHVLGANPWSVSATVARCQTLPAARATFQTWLVGLRIETAGQAVAVRTRVLQEAAA